MLPKNEMLYQKLYQFNPRQPQHRGININDTNEFLVSIQAEYQNQSAPSMWETLLEIKYNDFEPRDADVVVLNNQCMQFEENQQNAIRALCGTANNCQVEGTIEQSQSTSWHTARWPLITTSDSKSAPNIGEKLDVEP